MHVLVCGFVARYGGRLEIIADILNAVGNGAKKTKIMYVANLSYGLLARANDRKRSSFYSKIWRFFQ